MRRVRWKSVRVRLTLWNAVVLALLLAVSGTALCYRVQAALMHSVDRDLAGGADRVAGWWTREVLEGHRPPPDDRRRPPPDDRRRPPPDDLRRPPRDDRPGPPRPFNREA